MHNEGVTCSVNECEYHVECNKCRLEKIEVTKDPVGVKLLAKRINTAAGTEKITPVQITKYLLENGYLKMEFDHKTKTRNRVPTEKGTALGIENFWEINKFYREYSKNYYSEDAPTEDGNFWRYVNGVPTRW